MLSLFLGTCQAVQAMHTYMPGPSATYPPSSSSSTTIRNKASTATASNGKANYSEDVEQEEEDEEEGIRASAGADEPLIGSIDRAAQHADADESEAQNIPGLGETSGRLIGRVPIPSPGVSASGSSNSKAKKVQPYAHRDIKPANVMVSDEGTPILMDFGSALLADIPIPNRSVALAQADDASEHCSMPYRAPELFDPPVGSALDEKVDIWSLGCMLFAMAYGHSPFETEGGNITMAVRSGNYKFPGKDKVYSEGYRALVRFMLVVDPSKRPNIHQVVERTQQTLARV